MPTLCDVQSLVKCFDPGCSNQVSEHSVTTQADIFNSLDPQPLISEDDENFPPTINFFYKSQYIRQWAGALNSLFPLTVKLF